MHMYILSINYFNMSFVQVEEQAQVGGKGDHWHHQLANEAPSRDAAEIKQEEYTLIHENSFSALIIVLSNNLDNLILQFNI